MERSHDGTLRACCIGAGRMGSAITAAATRAGIDVVGGWTRSGGDDVDTLLSVVDVAFVAVPDDAIDDVVRDLDARMGESERDLLVVITSGVAQIERLAGRAPNLRLARIHPLRAITLDAPAGILDGAVTAVTATDDATGSHAMGLARRLGMRPFELDDEDAAAWHAAGTIAAGGVVTLLAVARDLAIRAGVDEPAALAAVADLATGAIAHAARTSPEHALTGPVARGDDGTVAAHRAMLGNDCPELLELYDALAGRTRLLAEVIA